ncbi:hypothetical protein VMCG_07708 [Cytospora schulzeri]|uniref:Fungal N-terminal domain-containing protein n=1 Tax=Cytospora schulzeri TaxID=448051 RepID=A0A423VYX4_9PEZI|nr:hypothetical protein VMCG_07708 [Valsa malicola]
MDPLTAFSLAASILQFIDVGSKVVTESVDIYRSATGASSVSEEAEILIGNITVIGDQLGKSLRPDGSYDVLNKYETHLEGLRLRSQELAQELLNKLAKLRVDGEKSMLKRVKSVGMALKIVFKDKDEIDELRKRLNGIRDELEAHVVVDMRNSINMIMVTQSEQYAHLHDLNKRMMEALFEALESNNTKVDAILRVYDQKATLLHEEMKTHVTAEHVDTRREITDRTQELKVTVTAFEEKLLSQNLKEHERTRKELQEIKDNLVRQIGEREASFNKQQERLNLKWQWLSEKNRKDLTKLQNELVLDISTKIYALEEIEKEYGSAADSSSPSTSWKVVPYPTPRLLVEKPPVRPKSADISSEIQRRQVSDLLQGLTTTQLSGDHLSPGPGEQGIRRRSLSSAFLQTAFVPRRPLYVVVLLQVAERPAFLLQLSVEELRDDEEFFVHLDRRIEIASRGDSYSEDGDYATVEFAEFYADDETHVRVVTSGAVPEADDQRWQYLPKPMDVFPPVGETTLMDYAKAPYTARSRCNVLNRLPKTTLKLKELLPDSSGKLWGLSVHMSLPRYKKKELVLVD